jgi:hypothetical protein
LKDAVADLRRKGLDAAKEQEGAEAKAVVATDKKTGLPLIVCKHAAMEAEEVTRERVAEILASQEPEWHHDAVGIRGYAHSGFARSPRR